MMLLLHWVPEQIAGYRPVVSITQVGFPPPGVIGTLHVRVVLPLSVDFSVITLEPSKVISRWYGNAAPPAFEPTVVVPSDTMVPPSGYFCSTELRMDRFAIVVTSCVIIPTEPFAP